MVKFIAKVLLPLFLLQIVSVPLYAEQRRSQGFEDAGELLRSGKSFGTSGKSAEKNVNMLQSERTDILVPNARQVLIYQVHILGEVKSPGTYRIAASDRLAEVVRRAGEIGDNGSERRIQLRRKGNTSTVDLLKFRLEGDLKNNPFVLDNDVIFVPLLKEVIKIVGPVKRPRVYELIGEKTLYDVVKLAGGFANGVAENDPIKIIRFEDSKKELIDVKNDEESMRSFSVKNGDVIAVSHVITSRNKFDYDLADIPGSNVFFPSYEDRVFVLGGVYKPGPYDFSPYYTIENYITLAGGLEERGTKHVTLIRSGGQKLRVKKGKMESTVVNPGDTIKVGKRAMTPAAWTSFVMGVLSFALSTTTTVLILRDR